MATTAEATITQALGLGFSIFSQKVNIDIDLLRRSLKGRTEIIVNPHSRDLRTIRLNCRQCHVKRITANGRACPSVSYEDPYLRAKLPWEAGVHQHHMLRRKIEGQLKNPPEEELVINLPKSVKIDEIDPVIAEAQSASATKLSVGSKKDSADDTTVDAITSRAGVESERRFTSIVLVVDYSVRNLRDGMHFVGWEEEDLRYPHAYTKNSSLPGTACCLFPCLDDLTARCTWEISITCPRTIGDALAPRNQVHLNGSNGVTNVDKVSMASVVNHNQTSFSDEDKALDLAVICTGDMTDEV